MKRKIIYFIVAVVLFWGGSILGYMAANSKHKEVVEILRDSFISIDNTSKEQRVREHLELLSELKRGNLQIVEENLLKAVQIHLKYSKEIDEGTISQAKIYQTEFCEDKCLGI